jgi:hypothetical protein
MYSGYNQVNQSVMIGGWNREKKGPVTALLLVVSLLLAACSPSIVGKWASQDEPGRAIEFLQDGTVNVYQSDTLFGTGAYAVDGDRITMTVAGQSATSAFKLEGDTLTLTGKNPDGSEYTTVFIRQ